MEQRECKVYQTTMDGDRLTPITLYEGYVKDQAGCLLESRANRKGRYSFIAKNPEAIVRADRAGMRIQDAKGMRYLGNGNWLEELRKMINRFSVENGTGIPFIGGAVGTFAYDLIRQFESIPDENPDYLEVPDLHLMFFSQVLVFDHHYQTLSLLVLEEKDEAGRQRAKKALEAMKRDVEACQPLQVQKPMRSESRVVRATSEEEFMERVKAAKQYIRDGDIFQVVLSRRWMVETNETPFRLYRKLRMLNPSPYLFYLSFGAYEVIGSSPEMLVRLEGDRVDTCPIAGTRPRGKNKAQDEALAAELLADPKEVSEHTMLLDLARNDMGRIAKFDSIQIPKQLKVERYSHVMHIVSEVMGMRRPEEDAVSVLRAFLPAGTLSGAPKVRAMEIIEELETERRGIYGGAVGYIGYDGNMDLCIAIRMMIYQAHRLVLQAGAGIVADSDPAKEAEECGNKVMALMKILREEENDSID